MNATTMEGLVGARINMNLVNTPMRVFKEARLKGDTATMERAMGYVGEFEDKAQEYKAEADKGMEEDAKEAREKVESEREEAVQKRIEEREKLEEEILKKQKEDSGIENQETKGCHLEISEEGKALLKNHEDWDDMDSDIDSGRGSDAVETDVMKEPVTYTKTGEAIPTKQGVNISVSV